MYAAVINVPGYMPDQVAEFETAREAWEYLFVERLNLEDELIEAGTLADTTETYSTLRHFAGGYTDELLDGETGTVHADVYTGANHDLGAVYSVESDAAEAFL